MSENYWNTTVSVSKSKADIDKLLDKFGVERVGIWEDKTKHVIGVQFVYKEIPIEFKLFVDRLIEIRKREKTRSRVKWEDKAPRMAMRVLYHHLKSALIAVEYGIMEFEDIFLSHVCTRNGQTIGEIVIPNLPKVVNEPGRLLTDGK